MDDLGITRGHFSIETANSRLFAKKKTNRKLVDHYWFWIEESVE